MSRIRQNVLELDEYTVEQKAEVKLNQNESPYDVPEDLKGQILSRMRDTGWNRYPLSKPVRLLESISKFTGHPTSGILAGVGSIEMIQALFAAVCGPGDGVVVVDPGFKAFDRICRLTNLEIIRVPLLDDYSFDVESIIESSKDARLIALATPNNPTGTSLTIEEVGEIAGEFDGTVLVDEAYYEFSRTTALGLMEEHCNIIIMRTLSKAFGLAGLRLGFLLAKPDLVIELDKARLPFSLATFQQIAGVVLIENRTLVNGNIDRILSERDRMHAILENIRGITPVRSDANFILFGVEGGSAPFIQETLRKRGVLIRHFNTQRLANMLRVTIGRPEENERFISELTRIMEGLA